MQLDACIPNFTLQEYTGEADGVKRQMVKEPLRLDGGYLCVPDAPGLGLELNDAALASLPARTLVPDALLGPDGSVRDR